MNSPDISTPPDRVLALNTLRICSALAAQTIAAAFPDDEEIITTAILRAPLSYKVASEALRNKPEVLLAAMKSLIANPSATNKKWELIIKIPAALGTELDVLLKSTDSVSPRQIVEN